MSQGTDTAGGVRTSRASLLVAVAVLGALLIAVALHWRGQPVICPCGFVKLWEGSIFSRHTSQHIADWYTLSHVVSGMLLVVAGRILPWRFGFTLLFGITIAIGTAWEILEHTEWVMRSFRATSLYSDYAGDSILNAVADYVWMLGGFLVAYRLRTGWIVALVLGMEIVSALAARDSLILSTLMVVSPVDAIEDWQQEANPHGSDRPGGEVARPNRGAGSGPSAPGR
ncbi:DUF2585 family protein [Cribrihabitans sp. XS_ASV171]